MSSYHDPQTAMTIARYARSDQIRRVAEHRRYLNATRTEPSVPNGRTRRWPAAMWTPVASAGRRAHLPAGEATSAP